jgi:hypothetical protein
MKIIVTHISPDWDAIASIWILKKYLPGWNKAKVEFVPAGQRLAKAGDRRKVNIYDSPIERVGSDEIIHVDTGLGPLDHHQTDDRSISAAGLCWEYIKKLAALGQVQIGQEEKLKDRKEAIDRVIKFIVDTDHFAEVFWPEASSDRYEFTILGVLEGLKLLKPNEDDYYVEWGREVLDSLMHQFENRIWAEREIRDHGKVFQTRWGRAIGFETLNDDVLKLAQKMGYSLAVRKDPRKGYVRIKARPCAENREDKSKEIDLTLAYEKLKKIDPEATWFLHASKKMLLNGTPKNPKMVPTKLSLTEIIEVLRSI